MMMMMRDEEKDDDDHLLNWYKFSLYLLLY